MKIFFYDQNLVNELHKLGDQSSTKVFRAIELLREFGNALRMPHSKKITTTLFELRTKGQEEIRLIYTFNKGTAVILHFFKKKTDKIPRKEIQTAENRRKILK
ncbi:MAG: type II toxin-antitoxin system RelE/ParE family toxin [Candidatus Gracilibacteria bacterium]|jgi:phage-related protein